MDNENENGEVKEFVETVPVEPSTEEELVDEQETETPESSSDEIKEPEAAEKESEPVAEETVKVEPKPVEGETPRERALRLEATRLKGLIRDQRKGELFVKRANNETTLPEDLKDYDPEQIKTFQNIAEKLGFARRDEIVHQTTQDRLNNEFDTFMEEHPEYSPENDKDGLLWNQFKSEFSFYNPPKDPKVLRKILNKVHGDIYGIQPAKNLNKINASQEKIKVASHTGASAGKETKNQPLQPQGLRIDALRGFTEEEKRELFG